jgi:hypothetical protein
MRGCRFWPVSCRHEQGAALNHPSQPLGRTLMHDVPSADPCGPETTRVLAAIGGFPSLSGLHAPGTPWGSRQGSDFLAGSTTTRREDRRWPKPAPHKASSGRGVSGWEWNRTRPCGYSSAREHHAAGIGAAVGRPHMILVAVHCESMFRISIAVPGSPRWPIS